MSYLQKRQLWGAKLYCPLGGSTEPQTAAGYFPWLPWNVCWWCRNSVQPCFWVQLVSRCEVFCDRNSLWRWATRRFLSTPTEEAETECLAQRKTNTPPVRITWPLTGAIDEILSRHFSCMLVWYLCFVPSLRCRSLGCYRLHGTWFNMIFTWAMLL